MSTIHSGKSEVDDSQLRYRVTELDPGLLSTPFEVQTNWHVITGAACSGKTTLIEMLADKGYTTIYETARLYFEEEMAKGRSLEEIREDGVTLQRSIKEMQRKLEQGIHDVDIAFLDRALPDSLTFHRIVGLNPNEILPECFSHRYASVFILDRLPMLRKKPLGPEDEFSASFLDEWLARDYCSLGYSVVRVPFSPPEERLEFVLNILSEQGLI